MPKKSCVRALKRALRALQSVNAGERDRVHTHGVGVVVVRNCAASSVSCSLRYTACICDISLLPDTAFLNISVVKMPV